MPEIQAQKHQESIPLSNGYIRVDAALCGGCKICMFACSLSHDGVAALDLSRIQMTSGDIDRFDTTAAACFQCADPQCMTHCPKHAIEIDPVTHARVVDQSLCIGCKLCIKSCPFTPARIRFDAVKKKAFKCDLCGGDPECVKSCPAGALAFVSDSKGVVSGFVAKKEGAQ